MQGALIDYALQILSQEEWSFCKKKIRKTSLIFKASHISYEFRVFSNPVKEN